MFGIGNPLPCLPYDRLSMDQDSCWRFSLVTRVPAAAGFDLLQHRELHRRQIEAERVEILRVVGLAARRGHERVTLLREKAEHNLRRCDVVGLRNGLHLWQ
jgi:hypothetical protein